MEIIKVTWEDAWSSANDNWTAHQMLDSSKMILESVGLLLNNTEAGIDIAMEYSPNAQNFRKVQHIPKAYIISIISLEAK